MLSFDASTFAIAGALAAAGPIIIHLLNRRRFRVVEWAAMDFLREALERNRRVMHFRDILLEHRSFNICCRQLSRIVRCIANPEIVLRQCRCAHK